MLQIGGATLSVISAVLFGASAVSARKALTGANASTGAMLGFLAGLPMLILAASLAGEMALLNQFSALTICILGLAGLTSLFAGRLLTFKAVDAIGANRSYAIVQTSPVYSSLLAIIFLGELLTVNSLIAIVFILGGSLTLARSSRAEDAERGLSRSGFGRGITYGISAGVFIGISNFLVSAGLRGTSFPLAGGVVSYAFALLGYLILLAPSRISHSRDRESTPKRSRVAWFMVDGSLRAGAVISLYIALQSTPVVIVSPISAAQSVFAILFSYLTIRKVEVFNVAVISGAVLVLSGVIVLYLPPP